VVFDSPGSGDENSFAPLLSELNRAKSSVLLFLPTWFMALFNSNTICLPWPVALFLLNRKKAREIDYENEIPFQKLPVPGFYDTTEERKRTLEISKVGWEFVFGGSDLFDSLGFYVFPFLAVSFDSVTTVLLYRCARYATHIQCQPL